MSKFFYIILVCFHEENAALQLHIGEHKIIKFLKIYGTKPVSFWIWNLIKTFSGFWKLFTLNYWMMY